MGTWALPAIIAIIGFAVVLGFSIYMILYTSGYTTPKNNRFYGAEKSLDETVFTTATHPSGISIRYLWNYGTQEEWLSALKHYDTIISRRNHKSQELELFINNIQSNDIQALSVQEFYDFLYHKYFVWKFTNSLHLAVARKHLRRYIDENRLSDLADIQQKLFAADHTNIHENFKIATEIHGLAAAGASGLLSILFPDHFGTVDQFVVKTLQEARIPTYKQTISQMNPNSLSVKDAIILTTIFCEKSIELNQRFHSNFWTPRKIDMVLWAFGRYS